MVGRGASARAGVVAHCLLLLAMLMTQNHKVVRVRCDQKLTYTHKKQNVVSVSRSGTVVDPVFTTTARGYPHSVVTSRR